MPPQRNRCCQPLINGQRRNHEQDKQDKQDREAIQQAVNDDRGERSALINPFTLPKNDRPDDLTEPHWKNHIGHQSDGRG